MKVHQRQEPVSGPYGKAVEKALRQRPYRDSVFLTSGITGRMKPGAISSIIRKSGGFKADIVVRELVWLDTEALKSIFAFLGKFGSQVEYFIWKAPSFINLLPFFDEPYDIGQEINLYGMNRIVNVQKAFELMALPEGKGEVVIGVEDAFFPVNTGNYRITWNNGDRSVEKTDIKKSHAEPDLSCDVSR